MLDASSLANCTEDPVPKLLDMLRGRAAPTAPLALLVAREDGALHVLPNQHVGVGEVAGATSRSSRRAAGREALEGEGSRAKPDAEP